MQPTTEATPVSKTSLWAGRILSGLTIAFLILDAVMKILKAEVSAKSTIELGYPESVVVPIGIVLLICTLLYSIPRTAFLGAILLTAYLGGAVTTNLRVGNPLFSHVLFPVYFGAMVWGGVYLRNQRLRTIILSNN
jgi:hypothetical protein